MGGFYDLGRTAHLSTTVHLGEKPWSSWGGLDPGPCAVKLIAWDSGRSKKNSFFR